MNYEEWFRSCNKSPPTSGWVWIGGLIQVNWLFALALWRVRNEDQHGVDSIETERKTRACLRVKIKAMYADQVNIPVCSHHIFNTPLPEMLERSCANMTRWCVK